MGMACPAGPPAGQFRVLGSDYQAKEAAGRGMGKGLLEERLPRAAHYCSMLRALEPGV